MKSTSTVTAAKSKMINDFSAFEEWANTLKKFRSVNTMQPVVFNLSEFSFHENVNLTTRIDYYGRSSYGKKTQGCFTTLALLVLLIDFVISLFAGESFSGDQLLLDFGIVLFSALTGKVTGLIYAHVCLLKLAQRIKKRLVCVYTVKPTIKTTLKGIHEYTTDNSN